MRRRRNVKRLSAEFIGTFALVFAGTGAVVINETTGGAVTHVGIALTFGLIVLAMIYSVGDISGAHLNPAVSFGFFAARRFPLRNVASYLVSQYAGAFAASGVLRLLFPTSASLGTTLPTGSEMQSFVLELILTAILMFVILGVSTGAAEKGITAGIVVGSVIGLEAMFAGPISGASMNPARSLAPAIISGHLSSLWIYIFAPVLGALVGVTGCRAVRGNACCSSREQVSAESQRKET
jgi:aquaporin NIP